MSSHQSTSASALIATTAAVTASLSWLVLNKGKTNETNQQDKKYDVPSPLTSGPYSEETKLAVSLAIEAGKNMLPHLKNKGTKLGVDAESALGIATKSNDADFCTKVDLINEDLITVGISTSFPNHVIIGEESTGTGEPAPLTNAPTWIIDPIDGTTNFASGSPLTCVSIGFCMNGEPVMGVAFSPQTEELYLAIKGKGAYRNGERIFSSDDKIMGSDDLPKKQLSNAVVCFEFGYARSEEGVDKMINAVKRILLHGCRTTRSYGSGVLDLCYTASGRIDVVYTGVNEEGWKPWDYCAAMVIAEEAGCTICSLKDDEQFDKEGKVIAESKFNIYSKSMICGVNTTIVEQCRNVVLQK